MPKFQTVRELVGRFGGPPKLADELDGISRRHIYNWIHRNSLPPQYDVALVSVARRVGVDVTYEDLAEMRALIEAE